MSALYKTAAAVLVTLALGAGSPSAAPGTPPPNVAGTTSEPPPAWFGASGVERWFAYGSYCWTTACLDFLPPARRTDLPKLVARPGQTLAIHLRFVPKSIRVRVLATGRVYPLVSARDTRWRIRGSGVIVVEVRATRGSASYLARIVS
jgi:hypothetical protein